MYTVVQKWGNSHGVRLPKLLLDALDIHENDRVEITQTNNALTIRKAEPHPHKTLEERLTAFYGKPLDQLEPSETVPDVDWGKPEGEEIW